MIEFVLTLDYEVFGSGHGTLAELVLTPTDRLAALLDKRGCPFVLFPEVAELELMEHMATDPDVAAVAEQVRHLRESGTEIGLHFHPWWYNARFDGQNWHLDRSEYNLCLLPAHRIRQMIDRALLHLRRLVGDPTFIPTAYRAGHLLMQPATAVAEALASRQILLDSSVFKGGVWREQGQDYRPALRNGYWWRFDDDPAVPSPTGRLLEVPIHTKMVPSWKMLTSKRIASERRSAGASRSLRRVAERLRDLSFLRPAKFDFCVMSLGEMKAVLDAVMREDRVDPSTYRPIVAIGHSKELVDLEAVEGLLAYLDLLGIPVRGLDHVRRQCLAEMEREAVS